MVMILNVKMVKLFPRDQKMLGGKSILEVVEMRNLQNNILVLNLNLARKN